MSELIYRNLEREMLTFSDYSHIPIEDNGEPLVPIPNSDHLRAQQDVEYMKPYTGDQVFVREGVLRELTYAAELLAAEDPRLVLDVRYGYRALEVQQLRFDAVRAEIERDTGLTGHELLVAAHRRIAVPAVAGHPTGGAVDLGISNKDGKMRDFGTELWAHHNRDSYADSPNISRRARVNRALLNAVMTEPSPTGKPRFARFKGEWWHYSYLDVEMAHAYGLPVAQYGQLDFRAPEFS